MLRSELQPHEPQREKQQQIKSLLREILEELEKGPLSREKQEAFTRLTGFKQGAEVMIGDAHERNLNALAEEFSYGPPPVVPDITRDELIEIVDRVFAYINQPGLMTWYCKLFDRNVPMPRASDMIFFPPQDLSVETIDYEPDPEEIVDRALNYKPISLL